MKLKVILCIILILVLPTASFSVASPSPQTSVSASHDFNFTKSQIGSFPANKSWIGFGSLNLTSSSSIGIEKAMGTGGLQVSTSGYGGPNQFLNLSLNASYVYTIQLTFSWNYNNSFVSTGNLFQLWNGNSNFLDYQFGPEFSKLVSITGSNTVNLGPEPSSNAFYTLTAAWAGNSKVFYTNIEKGWNITSSAPYAVSPKNPISASNLNLLIGGAISNVTIYNIFVNYTTVGFKTPVYHTPLNFKSESIASALQGVADNSTGWLPVVDQKLNSLLYFNNSTKSGIYAYNYYNNTAWEITSVTSGMNEVTSSNDTVYSYFVSSDKNGSVLTAINLNNFSSTSFNTSTTFSLGTHITSFGGSIYIISQNGNIVEYKLVNGQITLEKSVKDNLGKIVSIQNKGNSEILSFANTTGTGIIEYELSLNGTLVPGNQYELEPLDSGKVSSYGVGSNPASILNLGNVTGFNETIITGNNASLPLILNSGFSLLKSSGVYTMLINGSKTYAVSGGNVYPTDVNPQSNFTFISANLGFALSVEGTSLNLYFNGTVTFSGDNISLTFNPAKVISDNVSMDYLVNSTLNYTVKAEMNNITLNPSGGYLNFSTSNIPNGTYNITLTASNEAGYSATVNTEVEVDNFDPELFMNPLNNSAVLENSTVTINITKLTGPVNSSLEFGGFSTSSYTGTTIVTAIPNFVGNITMYLNVTDEFGVTRFYTFSYEVESVKTTGYSSNIIPYSFLSSGDLNLSWTPVKYVSLYNVSLFSTTFQLKRDTSVNHTFVVIGNGSYELLIKAQLQNTSWIQLVNESFTVQLYNPHIELTYTSDKYFSFFGNSQNNTLNLIAKSNISGTFSMRVFQNNRMIFKNISSGNVYSFQFNSNLTFLQTNGKYNVSLTITENSGRNSTEWFNFSVNNTIPTLAAPSGDIFTNNTSYSPGISPEGNETVYYHYINSSIGGPITGSNTSIKLQSLTNSIEIVALTKWGNTNISNITITASQSIPEIHCQVSSKLLVWNNYVLLNYSISDPVNLSVMKISLNNVQLSNITKRNGNMNITLPSDGNYSLSIYVKDECGNHNATDITGIVSEYYPNIQSLEPSVNMFMGFAHLKSNIRGANLESVNVTWVIDGSNFSNGRSVYAFLMPGEHNITLVATYHSHVIDSVRHVYTLGFVPEVTALVALVAIIAYRKYHGEDDVDLAEKLILENLGKTRSEIRSIARRNRIKIGTVDDSIQILSANSKIKLMPDPDGIVYVMPPENKM